jgi:YD repeat-containing protein
MQDHDQLTPPIHLKINIHKICSYLCGIIIPGLIWSAGLKAQESFPGLDKLVPASPNATSLVSGVQTPVSYYTGTPEVIIPLWNMKGRILEMPIQMSYHASGIKVEDLAGWVGLGWGLEATGVISRSVVGLADDMPGGYYTNRGNQMVDIRMQPAEWLQWRIPGSNDDEKRDFLQHVGQGLIDTEADVFNFNVNGIAGTFYFDVNGEIVLTSLRNLKIRVYLNEYREFDRWTIIDENGTNYEFGSPAATERTARYSDDTGYSKSWGSAWFLQSVRTANHEDLFEFEYSDYQQSVRYSLPHKKHSDSDPQWEEMYHYQEHFIEGKHLEKITYAQGTITFQVSTLYEDPPVVIRGMTQMAIHYGDLDSLFKSFQFHYSFFPATGCFTEYDYLPPCRRLRLDKIEEISANGKMREPPYLFFYNETPLPPRGSFAQDFWGYFNGASNDHMVPEMKLKNHHSPAGYLSLLDSTVSHDIKDLWMVNTSLLNRDAKTWTYPGANRMPQEEAMKMGLLEEMVHPSGAITIFEYEPHRFGYYCIPRPTAAIILDAAYRDQFSNFEEQRTLHIPFDQNISIRPLFYTIGGGIKDIEPDGMDPSDSSSVLLVGPLTSDADIDTVFSFSFHDYSEDPDPNWTREHEFWVKKGRYILVSIAHEEGDLTRLVCRYSPVQEDQVVRIHSREYETIQMGTDDGFYDDGNTTHQSVQFFIDSLDNRSGEINFYFSSDIHPEMISSPTPELPYTIVRISRLGSDTVPVFEREYAGASGPIWNENDAKWELAGNQVHLFSPGDYLMEFLPRVESEYGRIEIRYEKLDSILNEAMAGGVRIKRMIQMDEKDTLSMKSFKYAHSINGTVQSSGILMPLPVYHDLPEELFFLSGGTLSGGFMPLTLYSAGKSITGAAYGPHIGYQHVEVAEKGNGRIEYDFITSRDFPDITSIQFPFPPPISYDWKRGHLHEKRIYNESGTLRTHTIFKYNDLKDSLHNEFIPSLKVVQVYPDNPLAFAFEKYYHPTGWHHLHEKHETYFDKNGGRPHQKRVFLEFDPDHLQLVRHRETSDDQTDFVETFNYPGEGLCSEEVEDLLMSKHMVGTILRREKMKGGRLIGGEAVHYSIFHDSLVWPQSLETLTESDSFVKVYFDAYDNHGNLLQMHTRDGVFTSLNYDDEGLYPIAKTTNSAYRPDPADYADNASTEWYYNHPFFGLLKHTDPSGVNTSYHFDALGRLEMITNDDRSILKQYQYHLKGYSGDTSRPYFETMDLRFSTPADRIHSDRDTLFYTCLTQLKIQGGSLGTGAEWVWFKDQCGTDPIARGPSIIVKPDRSTMYLARAEGLTNKTACASRLVHVIPPKLGNLKDSVHVSASGTAMNPFIISLDYTGCDPLMAQVNSGWLEAKWLKDFQLELHCLENTTLESRSAQVRIYSGGVDTVLNVVQPGTDELKISLEASQRFASPGDEIIFSCSVLSGIPPFDFFWDLRMEASGDWIPMSSERDTDNSITSTQIIALNKDFSVRCRVISGDQSKEQIIAIRIVQ